MNSDKNKIDIPEMDFSLLPGHVAVIMDGNGRWAKKKLLNRVKGHEKGADTVREIVEATRELGIGVLTLYAFSTENWMRPKAEVSALMSLLVRFLENETQLMMENGIKLSTIGETGKLPENVQKVLAKTMAATKNNGDMVLNLALSYGGRSELVSAVKQIAGKIINGGLNPESIDEDFISGHLYTRDMPDPDLMIRTSGEMRVSNFLLWQLAYAEFYFTKTLWPDFTKNEYFDILKNYTLRDRRFGKIKTE